MSRRLRTLVIALLLGAIAGAVGVLLLLVSHDEIPLFHYVTDLNAHVAALDYAKWLGLKPPAYDNTPNDDLGIITIDDKTLKSGMPGPWPFARGYYGDLLTKLKAAGAKAVVFDIDFIEPSSDTSQDARFAQAMRSLPTVLAYTVNTTSEGRIGVEPPAPTLLPSAAESGFSTIDTPGGYLIGQPMVITTGANGTTHTNERLLSLAAAAFETYSGRKIESLRLAGQDGRFILMPPFTEHRQTGELENVTPQFAGRGLLSFADAYSMSANGLKPFANGALIFVGATAQGLGDYSTTARGRLPGLFINARFADQLLRRIYVTAAPVWFNVLLVVALPLLVALSFSLIRTPLAIVVSLTGTLAYAYADLAVFIVKLIWIDLVHVVLAMLLATMLAGLYRVLVESAQRRMVTNLFGMHVSPAVVNDILSQEDPSGALALKGKRVKATIFYSDIRGFTAMSETMTPEEIYAQLNEYFEEMCAIIFKYGGYVDKFIGDCVMAVFSAPCQTPLDAVNAVRSAVEEQAKIRELSEKWKALGKPEFTVGMGINTGDVVMGNLGAHSRMNYTVIGDNVNVAARLYNVAKGGEIIISETTYEEVRDFVIAAELEPVLVKGKSRPIRIYNVTGIREPAPTIAAAAAAPAPA